MPGQNQNSEILDIFYSGPKSSKPEQTIGWIKETAVAVVNLKQAKANAITIDDLNRIGGSKLVLAVRAVTIHMALQLCETKAFTAATIGRQFGGRGAAHIVNIAWGLTANNDKAATGRDFQAGLVKCMLHLYANGSPEPGSAGFHRLMLMQTAPSLAAPLSLQTGADTVADLAFSRNAAPLCKRVYTKPMTEMAPPTSRRHDTVDIEKPFAISKKLSKRMETIDALTGLGLTNPSQLAATPLFRSLSLSARTIAHYAEDRSTNRHADLAIEAALSRLIGMPMDRITETKTVIDWRQERSTL